MALVLLVWFFYFKFCGGCLDIRVRRARGIKQSVLELLQQFFIVSNLGFYKMQVSVLQFLFCRIIWGCCFLNLLIYNVRNRVGYGVGIVFKFFEGILMCSQCWDFGRVFERGLSVFLLFCRYFYDVVNYFSCDEVRNYYGGVVSFIFIVLDLMKEWIAYSEKLFRKVLQFVSEFSERQEVTGVGIYFFQVIGIKFWLRKYEYR